VQNLFKQSFHKDSENDLGLNNLKMILTVSKNPTNLATAQVISTLLGIEQRSLTIEDIGSQLNNIPQNSLLILNDENQICGTFEILRKHGFRGKILIQFSCKIRNSNPILNDEPKNNHCFCDLSLKLSDLLKKLSCLSSLSYGNLSHTQDQIDTPLKEFELQVLIPFHILEDLLGKEKSIADNDQFKENFEKIKNKFYSILSKDNVNAHKNVRIDRPDQIKVAFHKIIQLINNDRDNYTNEIHQQLDIIFNRWYNLKSYKELD
jgi:hypothetical protein